ncbi:MAG: hypothetical protein K1000chlam2_00845 [Chlamydiae bacterium]|nr:hypothetical protein [Chlamydiota bacterium]
MAKRKATASTRRKARGGTHDEPHGAIVQKTLLGSGGKGTITIQTPGGLILKIAQGEGVIGL